MNDYEKNFRMARADISEIDKEIAKLFEKRMKAAVHVAQYKKANGIPIEDLVRENQLIEANSSLIENDEIRSYYINFLKNTMKLSKDYQHKIIDGTRVAFSGVKGAFAEIAVKRIFPDAVPVPYPNFKAAYKAVENGECEVAVLPIENSYEGDVAPVMDLTYFGSLFINGVYDMAVEQHLFGTQDADGKTIKKVISHPQALGQCADFIEEKGYIKEETVNTAVAASLVAENNDPALGVICSLEAGNEYGLKLIDRKINKDSTNTTRFAVYSRVPRDNTTDRCNFIVLFTVRDEAGSLGKAISVFGECGYNLKALKSRPSKDVIWNYYFFLEGEGHLTHEAEEKMLSELSEVCTNVRLLGRYPKEQII
ncbi:MAG: chorismate mutase [Clostridia bacterium]|nr:chorismate mutase [Clostridia bacterium]